MNKKGVVWIPMFISIMLIIIVVLILNLVVGAEKVEALPENEFLNETANFIENGFEQTLIDFPDWIPFLPDEFNLSLNPFNIAGDEFNEFSQEQIRTFSVVPDWLLYTLGGALILGVILLFLSFIRGTG